MGIGRFRGGAFDLVVSVRYDHNGATAPDGTPADLARWQNAFAFVSKLLNDATDGQMHIGTVYFAENSLGSHEADGYLFNSGGDLMADIAGLRLGDMRMTLRAGALREVFTVVHEFGHYAFGLYEERQELCTEDPGGQNACIMEAGIGGGLGMFLSNQTPFGIQRPGLVHEFCWSNHATGQPGNHDPNGDTVQATQTKGPGAHPVRGFSCWESIEQRFATFGVAKPPGLPDTTALPNPPPITWQQLATPRRYALALDKSGSMQHHQALVGAKIAAKEWIDYNAAGAALENPADPDELAIVTFDEVALTPLLLQALTAAQKQTEKNKIDLIQHGGFTNISGALTAALAQVAPDPANLAATQVVVLLSDGKQENGPFDENVVDLLVERGVRVFTIGFGDGVDTARLFNIARATAGTYTPVPTAEIDEANPVAIAAAVAEVGAKTHSGLVARHDGVMLFETGLSQEITIPVERGAQRLSVVVYHRTAHPVTLSVERPDGKGGREAVGVDDYGVQVVDGDEPYSLVLVDSPVAGDWRAVVSRASSDNETHYSLLAFTSNEHLTVGLAGPERVWGLGEEIKITAHVAWEVPLTGIVADLSGVDTEGFVESPPGSGVYEAAFTLEEDGFHELLAVFRNAGAAETARGRSDHGGDDDEELERFPDTGPRPPEFTRVVRFFVNVERRSNGPD